MVMELIHDLWLEENNGIAYLGGGEYWLKHLNLFYTLFVIETV